MTAGRKEAGVSLNFRGTHRQQQEERGKKWCPALSFRDGRLGIAVFLKVAVKVLSRWKSLRCDYIPKRLYV